MSARAMESFIARFKVDPRLAAEKAGLADEEVRSIEKLDFTCLELASRSFPAKRVGKKQKMVLVSVPRTVLRFLTARLRPFHRRT